MTGWNGIPDHPDRDGWHWVEHAGWTEPRYWFSAKPPVTVTGYWRGSGPLARQRSWRPGGMDDSTGTLPRAVRAAIRNVTMRIEERGRKGHSPRGQITLAQ